MTNRQLLDGRTYQVVLVTFCKSESQPKGFLISEGCTIVTSGASPQQPYLHRASCGGFVDSMIAVCSPFTRFMRPPRRHAVHGVFGYQF